ncbi:MAG: AraC family transcriptional regulator [Bacteroidales bacterium]|nr:AraC family transcriptional regulator [Bacteroidales bacterium]
MTKEQEEYMALVEKSGDDKIHVKKTGLEDIYFENHSHSKFQFIYTLSGTLHLQTSGARYFIPEKHIAWIPPHTVHRMSSNNRQVSLVIFYISNKVLRQNKEMRDCSIRITDKMIAENIKFIADHGPIISDDSHEAIYRFATGFLNLLPLTSPGEERFQLSSRIIPEDTRLCPVLEYIDTHSCDNLKMEDVARKHGLSARTLSRMLHQSGIHFSRYVNQARVMRAIELAADGGKSMKEIAYETGFSTPGNFSRVFRQVTGKSPSIYSMEI